MSQLCWNPERAPQHVGVPILGLQLKSNNTTVTWKSANSQTWGPKTKLRNNLNKFTLEKLKKEIIKMKKVNFAVTRMKRNQVVELIMNYHYLFPHLLNKTGTKRQAKPKQDIPPASITLPLNYYKNWPNKLNEYSLTN